MVKYKKLDLIIPHRTDPTDILPTDTFTYVFD